MVFINRENIPLNQISSMKCIIVIICAFPVLQKYFETPSATLAFDTARKLSAYRAGNDSIPGHLKDLETLTKCLALFTRDNPVKNIVDAHLLYASTHEHAQTAVALSLLKHLIPYFK